MKDNRFNNLNRKIEKIEVEKKVIPKKTSIFLKLTQKAHNLLDKIEDLNKRNRQKFKPEPTLQKCNYCNRNKYFPCTSPRHMLKETGLCPDQICVRMYQSLSGEKVSEIEEYPPYRS